MNLDFGESENDYRAELRATLQDNLPKDWQGIFAGEDTWKWSTEFCRILGEKGWLTQTWPIEFGGRAASSWTHLVTAEELWAHNEPRGGQYMNVNWIGPAIMHFGTDEQKQKFLPRMSAGDVTWGQGFSEPDAGSDLAGLRMRADVIEGGFIVNGRKTWTSYGDIADYMFLVARTVPGSTRKVGCSVLLVDLNLPGIHRNRLKTPLGLHRQAEEVFEDVFVPTDALLGPLHDGWRVATTALAFERVGIPRYGRVIRVLGILAREFGDTWNEYQIERFMTTLALANAAALCTYRATATKEKSDAPKGVEPSMVMIYNSMLEAEYADLVEDLTGIETLISGDDPYVRWNGEAEALWRNAPTATITAGSLEVQLEVVAGTGMGLGR
jgi:alkylation response protein AidB-like acyl-CoA dehydrogenase